MGFVARTHFGGPGRFSVSPTHGTVKCVILDPNHILQIIRRSGLILVGDARKEGVVDPDGGGHDKFAGWVICRSQLGGPQPA